MQLNGHPGAVTPEGVRDGDPAALAALCERRGGAVLAYALEVCEPAGAPDAAAEALARFRAAVWASGDAADLEPDRLLLAATRHAAAASSRRPGDVGTARRIVRRDHTDVCAQIPTLIVARAEGLLGAADQERLARHLDRCSSCRELEAAFRRAERAYGSTSHVALDSPTIALFLGALAEAAPVAELPPEPEPEPEPAPEPEPEPEPTLVAVAAAEPDVPPQDEAVDDLDDDDADGWSGEPDQAPDDREAAGTVLQVSAAHWALPEISGFDGGVPARRRRGWPVRVALPVLVVIAGAVAAMALAGVFDGI